MSKQLVITFILLVVSGCAALQPVPTETLSKLPVVQVGNVPPTDSEYIVYYPAGQDLPIQLKANGSLFTKEKSIESHVTLTKDLYLYKYWASHDKEKWENSHELLGVEFGGGLDVSGIHVNVKLDKKYK